MLKAKIVAVDDTFMVGSDTCVFTGKPYQTAKFHKDCVTRYNRGKFIQDAFPNLSAEDREFLMSRISPEGWEQEFGEEEDEMDD